MRGTDFYRDFINRILNNEGIIINGSRSWDIKVQDDSIAQIGKSIENKFILEDWQNIGPFYDRTLIEWLNRFKSTWPTLNKYDDRYKYDDRFYKMWVYCLSCCAASFRAKKNDLWQIVFSKTEDNVFYRSVR